MIRWNKWDKIKLDENDWENKLAYIFAYRARSLLQGAQFGPGEGDIIVCTLRTGSRPSWQTELNACLLCLYILYKATTWAWKAFPLFVCDQPHTTKNKSVLGTRWFCLWPSSYNNEQECTRWSSIRHKKHIELVKPKPNSPIRFWWSGRRAFSMNPLTVLNILTSASLNRSALSNTNPG